MAGYRLVRPARDPKEGTVMFRSRKRLLAVAVGVGLLVAGCSSSGGKKSEEQAAGVGAGQANTARMTVAMITHAAQGDTFWDIVRKGAEAAAQKDNVDLKYSADPDSTKQAALIQGAIDRKVDGLAVTPSDPAAIAPAVKKAVDAGIPAMAFNQGFQAYQASGALAYFGSNEQLAGETAGKLAAQQGAKHILCIPQ